MTQETAGLVLEVLKKDSLLEMSLFEQRESASTLRHYSSCRIDPAEISQLCLQATALLNRIDAAWAASHADLIKSLKKTGQLLFSHLLTQRVRDKLRLAQESGLILCLDEELIGIPWELLYTGDEFLCLKFNLGRVVRTGEQSPVAQYRSFPLIPSMLILANPTGDLKSAYLEGLNIKNQFSRRSRSVRIDFKSTCIDKIYVKKNLCDYDIVHFAGHAEFSGRKPQDSGWVLSGSRFGPEDILSAGAAAALPALVFSNACYSARASTCALDDDYQQKYYSLAQAFLFSGVRHYLGAIRRIEDPASFVFAKEFYDRLLSGRAMGESVRLARLKLIKEYGYNGAHWANYLLYGDPNFVLFKAAHKQKGIQARGFKFHKKKLAWLALALAAIYIIIYLYMRLPELNPGIRYLYRQAKNAYLAGRNQQVISLSNSLIKKDPKFLDVYPQLADTYLRMGDKEKALRFYFDYALSCEKKGARKELACAYSKLGWFYFLYGEYPKAKDYYQRALDVSSANNDKLNEADVLSKLALWYMERGDDNRGLELLTKSVLINRQRQHIPEHKYALACDYFNLGLLFTNKDDFKSAKEFYDLSFALFAKLKMRHELSDYYFNIGEICSFRKEYARAMEFYLKGLAIDEEMGNRFNFAGDYNMIGELYMQMEDFKSAEVYFRNAAEIAKEISLAPEQAAAYYNLGLLYKTKGRLNSARENLRLAQEIYSRMDELRYKEVQQALMDLSGS